ncbi:MAG: UDP-N-acetylmuramate--L-alanine ligase, partial [Xanthomonadales bacterium]|nr:UDP-N-acetylmuramate--L-alanine ligase [Xanthomonadales bacterium]
PHVADIVPELTRTMITYGFSKNADIRATRVRQDAQRMHFNVRLPHRDDPLAITLNLPGRHNVLNALAAIAVGWELGVKGADMQQALSQFQGIGRRFNVHGEIDVAGVRALFVDDYGHHPTELAATIEAARNGWPKRRLVAVFQPHRFSRTRDLLDDFAAVLSGVDALILAEVYPAGEQPINGADGRSLARAIRSRGQVDPVFVNHPRECREVLPGLVHEDDLVLLLGAGDIGAVASEIYESGFEGGR